MKNTTNITPREIQLSDITAILQKQKHTYTPNHRDQNESALDVAIRGAKVFWDNHNRKKEHM